MKKVAIVTGGTSGIGLATARPCAGGYMSIPSAAAAARRGI